MKQYKCINGHFFNIKPHVAKYSSVFVCPVCGSSVSVHVPVKRKASGVNLNQNLLWREA